MSEINPKIFQNTQNAFASKSDKELKKAHFIFRMMGYKLLNDIGTALLKFALKIGLPITELIKNTIFAQFCGGESVQESQAAIDELAAFNIGTILDYSVEGEKKESVFEATKNEILQTIIKANGAPEIPFCVFKLTGVGRFDIYKKIQAGQTLSAKEKDEYQNIVRRVEEICALAKENDTPVFIDAEETWIQDTVDSIAMEMMAKFNSDRAIVYNTIQFYRADAMKLLEDQYQQSIEGSFYYGIKMVRGAYMEQERERAGKKGYASPIHKNKESTDQCYDDGLRFCVDKHPNMSLCAGTHNEESSKLLMKLMLKKGIEQSDSNFYFAQLYGMSDHISFNAAKEGYRVAKYVPYGPVKSVMPYLIRRAEENTSVAGQMGRELSLIKQEIERRKKDV